MIGILRILITRTYAISRSIRQPKIHSRYTETRNRDVFTIWKLSGNDKLARNHTFDVGSSTDHYHPIRLLSDTTFVVYKSHGQRNLWYAFFFELNDGRIESKGFLEDVSIGDKDRHNEMVFDSKSKTGFWYRPHNAQLVAIDLETLLVAGVTQIPVPKISSFSYPGIWMAKDFSKLIVIHSDGCFKLTGTTNSDRLKFSLNWNVDLSKSSYRSYPVSENSIYMGDPNFIVSGLHSSAVALLDHPSGPYALIPWKRCVLSAPAWFSRKKTQKKNKRVVISEKGVHRESDNFILVSFLDFPSKQIEEIIGKTTLSSISGLEKGSRIRVEFRESHGMARFKNKEKTYQVIAQYLKEKGFVIVKENPEFTFRYSYRTDDSESTHYVSNNERKPVKRKFKKYSVNLDIHHREQLIKSSSQLPDLYRLTLEELDKKIKEHTSLEFNQRFLKLPFDTDFRFLKSDQFQVIPSFRF